MTSSEDKERNLGLDLVKSVSLPRLREALAMIAEMGLDRLLDDGLAKDVPFFGSIIKLHDTIIGIRDRLFIYKIAAFITEAEKLTDVEKAKWLEKIGSNTEEATRIGATSLMVIDRLTSEEKSAIAGRLIRGRIREEIDTETYIRLCEMIDRAYLSDLKLFAELEDDYSLSGLEQSVLERLAGVGILKGLG